MNFVRNIKTIHRSKKLHITQTESHLFSEQSWKSEWNQNQDISRTADPEIGRKKWTKFFWWAKSIAKIGFHFGLSLCDLLLIFFINDNYFFCKIVVALLVGNWIGHDIFYFFNNCFYCPLSIDTENYRKKCIQQLNSPRASIHNFQAKNPNNDNL